MTALTDCDIIRMVVRWLKEHGELNDKSYVSQTEKIKEQKVLSPFTFHKGLTIWENAKNPFEIKNKHGDVLYHADVITNPENREEISVNDFLQIVRLKHAKQDEEMDESSDFAATQGFVLKHSDISKCVLLNPDESQKAYIKIESENNTNPILYSQNGFISINKIIANNAEFSSSCKVPDITENINELGVATNKKYVDNSITSTKSWTSNNFIPINGTAEVSTILTGSLFVPNVTEEADPGLVVNKQYVDTHSGSGGDLSKIESAINKIDWPFKNGSDWFIHYTLDPIVRSSLNEQFNLMEIKLNSSLFTTPEHRVYLKPMISKVAGSQGYDYGVHHEIIFHEDQQSKIDFFISAMPKINNRDNLTITLGSPKQSINTSSKKFATFGKSLLLLDNESELSHWYAKQDLFTWDYKDGEDNPKITLESKYGIINRMPLIPESFVKNIVKTKFCLAGITNITDIGSNYTGDAIFNIEIDRPNYETIDKTSFGLKIFKILYNAYNPDGTSNLRSATIRLDGNWTDGIKDYMRQFLLQPDDKYYSGFILTLMQNRCMAGVIDNGLERYFQLVPINEEIINECNDIIPKFTNRILTKRRAVKLYEGKIQECICLSEFQQFDDGTETLIKDWYIKPVIPNVPLNGREPEPPYFNRKIEKY